MKIGIIDLCKQIEDPRMNRKKVHKMETIIYISIAAVICGAQSWNEIEEFGNANVTKECDVTVTYNPTTNEITATGEGVVIPTELVVEIGRASCRERV